TARGRRPAARFSSACRPFVRTAAAACARSRASCAVMTSPFASPRTPSVPNSLPMQVLVSSRDAAGAGSALRELRGLAGLLETGLLALDDAGVAREEARLLERRAVVLPVDLVERAGDREPQRTGLARGTAARDPRRQVVGADEVEDLERRV